MKRRILFVDDEPNVLEGLRNRLHKQRKKWDMQFTTSGVAALELVARAPVDVVVSDMRMPGMDGATLLGKVRECWPQVVRIVLSGHAEVATSLRAVPVAHQFLSKPCEPGAIEAAIERACKLQALVTDPLVEKVVGGVANLPPAPRIYQQLVATLTKEDVTVAEIARIICQDMALSAKLLQLANSSFLRLSRTMSSVEQAVVYLGHDAVKHLVLAAEVFGAAVPTSLTTAADLDVLQRHAIVTAQLASSMFSERTVRDDAFITGLLHDVGRLLLAVELPNRFVEAGEEASRRGIAVHEAELSLWGVTHAEVGGYLLALWGLPYDIVERVANHHEPGRVGPPGKDVLTAVHVADVLAREAGSVDGRNGSIPPVLDDAMVSALELDAGIDEWRGRARELSAAAFKA